MAGTGSPEETSKTPPVRIGGSIKIHFLDTGELATYVIGLSASDPANGILNHQTALAIALLGQRAGDTVLVNSCNNPYSVKILSVNPE